MKKFRNVVLDIEINTSKDEVWDLLFNRFGEVNNFNPLTEGSHHTTGVQGEVGCERQCDLDSRNSVQERISARRGTNGFDVDIIKGGLPMMDKMKGSFELRALSTDRTSVQFTMSFTTSPSFLGFFMAPMMPKMLKPMLVGLKYYLETGNKVTKENIDGIMSEYKSRGSAVGFGQPELGVAV